MVNVSIHGIRDVQVTHTQGVVHMTVRDEMGVESLLSLHSEDDYGHGPLLSAILEAVKNAKPYESGSYHERYTVGA